MNEDWLFLQQYQSRGALFDANILLVYVVGKYNKNLLSSLHHTKQYADDFPLIEKLVESFRILYTTPHVLTEGSNLGKKGGGEFFDQLSKTIRIMDERYCSAKDAALNSKFRKLGLTESALMNLSPKSR